MLKDGACREDARMHRVVNAFERRHVHEPRCIAEEHDTVAGAALRERIESALGDGFRAPLDHFAAGQELLQERMPLELLEQDVHVQTGIAIVEAHDEPQRNEVRLERIHEAPAECIAGQRPTERVDHAIERSLRLPQLFHAQREDLWVVGRDALPLTPRLREQPPRPLGERRDFRSDIVRRCTPPPGSRLPVADWVALFALVAVAIETGGRGPHAGNSGVPHEQLCRRKPGEHVDTEPLGLGAEPAHDLAERGDVVAAIVHGGRRREAKLAAFGQHVDRFLRHRTSKREVRVFQVGKQLAERARVHDGA